MHGGSGFPHSPAFPAKADEGNVEKGAPCGIGPVNRIVREVEVDQRLQVRRKCRGNLTRELVVFEPQVLSSSLGLQEWALSEHSCQSIPAQYKKLDGQQLADF